MPVVRQLASVPFRSFMVSHGFQTFPYGMLTNLPSADIHILANIPRSISGELVFASVGNEYYRLHPILGLGCDSTECDIERGARPPNEVTHLFVSGAVRHIDRHVFRLGRNYRPIFIWSMRFKIKKSRK